MRAPSKLFGRDGLLLQLGHVGGVLLLGVVEALLFDQQLLGEDAALVALLGQVRGEGRKLVLVDVHAGAQVVEALLHALVVAALLDDLALQEGVGHLDLLVLVLLLLQEQLTLVQGLPVVVYVLHDGVVVGDLLADALVAPGDVFGHLLPLHEHLVALLVLFFEFLRGLVQLDLGGLGLGDFGLEVVLLAAHFEG